MQIFLRMDFFVHRDSYAVIKIYYGQMEYTYLEQEYEYTIEKLLGERPELSSVRCSFACFQPFQKIYIFICRVVDCKFCFVDNPQICQKICRF